MNFLINIGAKLAGITATVTDLATLLLPAGSIVGVVAAILVRAGSGPHDLASLVHNLHPTATEAAVVATSLGAIKAHYMHQENAANIATTSAITAQNTATLQTNGIVPKQ